MTYPQNDAHRLSLPTQLHDLAEAILAALKNPTTSPALRRLLLQFIHDLQDELGDQDAAEVSLQEAAASLPLAISLLQSPPHRSNGAQP